MPPPPPRSVPAPLVPAPPLASGRYNRQLLLPQLRLRGQTNLLDSKILIIGLGGLGSPAALYLAGAGVGTLGLMDGDTVELGNLHRQIAHTERSAREGLSKVRSAAARCRETNSEIKYVLHEQRAAPDNILDVVAQYDLVLDCTDNPATRYLISDACVVLNKVLVSGAAQRGEGTLVVLNGQNEDGRGPCYRCVFPRPPPPEMVRGCSEIGVLGPVVGVVGTLMAGEAIKLVAGGHLQAQATLTSSTSDLPDRRDAIDRPRHTMLLYNTYAADPRHTFRTVTLRGRRKDCVACGDRPTLTDKGLAQITADAIARGGLDYRAFCGVVEDLAVLADDRRVDAETFFDTYDAHHHDKQPLAQGLVVVDVREPHEYELGAKVAGSVSIPLTQILRSGGAALDELLRRGAVDPQRHDDTDAADQDPPAADRRPPPVYFVCQRGNDSQVAAQRLIERVEMDGREPTDTPAAASTGKGNLGWIGDVKGGFLAMERYAQNLQRE